MAEKAVWPSSVRFAISLAVFTVVWIFWFSITEYIYRESPLQGDIYVLPYIQIGLCPILPIAAAYFHSKKWLLKVIWFIPYAAGMMATMSLALFGVQELLGYSDDKTIIGLLLGIPILILAIGLAALAASISARIKRSEDKAAP
jgi:D-alanyl-lipoteichoic acid acyltransferase DltB (MBOAT superfamily)